MFCKIVKPFGQEKKNNHPQLSGQQACAKLQPGGMDVFALLERAVAV